MSHTSKNDFTIEFPKFNSKVNANDYAKKITTILAHLGHGHLELIADPEWNIKGKNYLLISQPTGEGLYIGDRKLHLNLDSVVKSIPILTDWKFASK